MIVYNNSEADLRLLFFALPKPFLLMKSQRFLNLIESQLQIYYKQIGQQTICLAFNSQHRTMSKLTYTLYRLNC